MTAAESIISIIVFVFAGALLAVSILHFLEKGVPINNAYLYASKEERKTMDKKPHYRQSAIVFLLLSLVFAVIGLSVVLQNSRISLLEIPLLAAAVVYAAASSGKRK